jgi:uncharacterized protein YecE (DUF72 family)
VEAYVGTSGFSYPAWRGHFYPQDLREAEMLAFYATRLRAVEINNTFYRMPTGAAMAKWAAQVPDGFRFAVKAPRRITHVLKLADAGELVQRLGAAVVELGPRQGPVLFQLPPYLRKDVDLLARFLDAVPAALRVALQVGHPSWREDDVLSLLSARGVALCFVDDREDLAALTPTAPFGYLRLRRESYADADVAALAAAVRAQPWGEVHAFLKHEEEGPALAARFATALAAT